MLTPSSGIVRSNPEFECAHCKQTLRNFARYPFTGAHWRCVNRACHGSVFHREEARVTHKPPFFPRAQLVRQEVSCDFLPFIEEQA